MEAPSRTLNIYLLSDDIVGPASFYCLIWFYIISGEKLDFFGIFINFDLNCFFDWKTQNFSLLIERWEPIEVSFSFFAEICFR